HNSSRTIRPRLCAERARRLSARRELLDAPHLHQKFRARSFATALEPLPSLRASGLLQARLLQPLENLFVSVSSRFPFALTVKSRRIAARAPRHALVMKAVCGLNQSHKNPIMSEAGRTVMPKARLYNP